MQIRMNGNKGKLIERFKRQPKDFTFNELTRLFQALGFKISQKGKTSGSRIEFVNSEKELSYGTHKPHPDSAMKSCNETSFGIYIIEQVNLDHIMGTLKYKGYSGTVEYSEEDNCLFGKVIGMNKNLISYEGKTVEELKADFEAGIELYLESCKERGVKPQKPYSGSLNIRIPSEVHSQLALKAQLTGRSINAIIKDLLTSQQNLLNA